jgi:alpha-beta hydrolase superfamily lysophospholipase
LLDADRLAIVAAAPRFHMHLMPACIFSPEQLAALDSDEGRFAWPAAGRPGGDRLHVTRADVDVVRAVDMGRAVAAIPEQVPVLLLHGTDDELIPVADAQEFAAARKSIEVCIVDGARHAFRGKKPLKQLLTTATTFIGDAHRKFFCQ